MSYTPIEQKLREQMLTFPALQALVGASIFPVQLPSGFLSANPSGNPPIRAITIQRISTLRLTTHDGATNALDAPLVQFTAWCKGSSSAYDAANVIGQLRNFLNQFSATGILTQRANVIVNERMTVYPQTQPPMFLGILEARIWNNESIEGENDVSVASVVITPAQIAAANSTPVIIIPAPGPGQMIIPLSPACFSLEPGSSGVTDFSGLTVQPSLYYGLDNTGINLISDFPDPGDIVPNVSLQKCENLAVAGGSLANLPVVWQFPVGSTGRIVSYTVANGGTGNPTGSTFIVSGAGGGDAHGVVTVDSGGVAVAVNITVQGTNYAPNESNVTTSRSLTLNILTVQSMADGNTNLRISMPYVVVPV